MRKKLYRDKAEKIEKSKVRETVEFIIYCGLAIIVGLLIVRFVGQRTEVIGESMSPTLEDGDNLIVDKITYRFSDPKRFDIIVFPFKENRTVYYIKRIIGLPGETVQIQDGKIYINGIELNEDYGAEPIEDPGIASAPITLGEDEYFVLGDNRNNSQDSRTAAVGNISRDEIFGRAWIRFWPLDSFCILKHQ
ncbi:MAG TPA: signal peptidase I [Candidatus Onthocola gallistercoris]|uniref:Signal peptidase I n=1 Tax=Candidatus Onthocola gallistercoris TaxID=2840876 RepID=A0A9D1HH50_9FIRM|nr:signal peptidase I [Candidatus Onthocola gallistercoris]